MEAVPPPVEPEQEASNPPARAAEASRFFTGWDALRNRVWGTDEFLRLWLAQVVTSTGEWVFFLVVTIKTAQVSGTPEGAVALVLLARLGPGFFLSQLAGVLADRWDRRKLMAICDICRAAVVCAFPFLDHVWQLVLLSLVLEIFTLLWMPAKEALVPNLLPRKHLPTANTLSVVATYGTFPLAVLLMLVLGGEGGDDTDIGFWFDAITFVVSAVLVLSIAVRNRTPESVAAAPATIDSDKLDVSSVWAEMRDGWKLAFGDPTLRAVNFGLAVGLIGGGMLVPLGTVYATEVLGADNRGYYGMLVGLGIGLAVGALFLINVSEQINRPWVFGRAVLVAGLALMSASMIDVLWLVILQLGAVGAAVGVVYVLGFTIIQETTDDEMRGRVFAAFYSLARGGVLVAMVAAPALAVFFDRVTELSADGAVGVFGYRLLIPGVRITFWLASLIIISAGWVAVRTLRGAPKVDLRPVD